jgi:peptide deformylase
MTLRTIIEIPDPLLRTISKPVKAVTPQLQILMKDMLESMYAAPGIGLAAIQVGVPKRVIVIDCASEEDGPDPMYFVNPVITWQSDVLIDYNEGCLSVPEHYAKVIRPDECHVEYLDFHGDKQAIKAAGLLAVCIQHEVDHLDGILFIDHISKLKREMILKKMNKSQKTGVAM